MFFYLCMNRPFIEIMQVVMFLDSHTIYRSSIMACFICYSNSSLLMHHFTAKAMTAYNFFFISTSYRIWGTCRNQLVEHAQV